MNSFIIRVLPVRLHTCTSMGVASRRPNVTWRARNLTHVLAGCREADCRPYVGNTRCDIRSSSSSESTPSKIERRPLRGMWASVKYCWRGYLSTRCWLGAGKGGPIYKTSRARGCELAEHSDWLYELWTSFHAPRKGIANGPPTAIQLLHTEFDIAAASCRP